MFSLEQKTAVITGAAKGIGQAIASLFSRQGADVHILDLDEESGKRTADEILTNGYSATFHRANVTDQKEILELFRQIFDQKKRLDILVNNAGVAAIGKLENTKEEDFDRVLAVNVKGVYNCSLAAVELMKKNGGGVILNMASIAGMVGIADRLAYSASKGAVVSMTYSIARDYLDDNIRCNSISPARVHTPFVDGYLKQHYPGREKEMFDVLSKTQPIGRMGEPEEIAALALYLCSEEAAFITGSNFPIDGGFTTLKV
ncbi:MAG: glucose 1-dehydrogenase [Balneolaceae bacterium]|nr:MAG: glucose 1-dehydrogenase [Balneolaceae bacterium]